MSRLITHPLLMQPQSTQGQSFNILIYEIILMLLLLPLLLLLLLNASC